MRVSDSSERPVDLFGELSKEQLVAMRGTDLLQQIATWPQKTTHTHTQGFVWVDLVKSSPQGCDQKFAAQSCFWPHHAICAVLISIINSHWKSLSSSFSSYSLISHAKPAAGSGRLARHAGLPCPAAGRGAPGAPGRQGGAARAAAPRGAGSRGSGATAVAGGGGAADVDLGAGNAMSWCWGWGFLWWSHLKNVGDVGDPVALGNSSGLWLLGCFCTVWSDCAMTRSNCATMRGQLCCLQLIGFGN